MKLLVILVVIVSLGVLINPVVATVVLVGLCLT